MLTGSGAMPTALRGHVFSNSPCPRKAVGMAPGISWKTVMTRRRIAVVFAGLAGFALAATWALAFIRPSAVLNYHRYSQLTSGMRVVEIEAVLGGPPGDYRTEDVRPFGITSLVGPASWQKLTWQGNECEIEVYVGE